jgi:hypothetical protein
MTLDLDSLQAMGRNALRRVALGQITSDNGTLGHHSDVLLPDVITALQVLHRHGFIALTPHSARSDRPTAELTLSGIQLLDWWNRQPATDTRTVGSASATTPAPTDAVTGMVTRGQSS